MLTVLQKNLDKEKTWNGFFEKIHHGNYAVLEDFESYITHDYHHNYKKSRITWNGSKEKIMDIFTKGMIFTININLVNFTVKYELKNKNLQVWTTQKLPKNWKAELKFLQVGVALCHHLDDLHSKSVRILN